MSPTSRSLSAGPSSSGWKPCIPRNSTTSFRCSILNSKAMAGRFFRYLWLALALLVILYALLVVAARELFPVVNRFQPQINAYLSQQTGMDFSIRQLQGLWRGFTPRVDLGSVVIAGRDGHPPAVTASQLSAELRLGESLLNLSPVWRSLTAASITLVLAEDELGNWTLGGYPLGLGSGGENLDYLYRMFYYSRLLRIDRLAMEVQFFSGARAQLFARDILVENQGGFHRATATLALDDTGANVARFVFEGRGDPADPEDFVGTGYVHGERISVEDSLDTLASAWMPELVQKIQPQVADLDLEFWFDWRDNALVAGRGRLTAAALPLSGLPGAPRLDNLAAQITGWFTPGEDWGLRIQDLRADWDGRAIRPLDLVVRQRVGRRWREFELGASHLDLSITRGILLDSGLLDPRAAAILEGLTPGGSLHQLSLALDLSGPQPDFLLRANLDDIAVDSWRGAPAARGLSGYLEAGLRQGLVVMDGLEGLTLHYPQVYHQPMAYGSLTGKVAWRWLPDEDRVLVTSNRMTIAGEEGAGVAFLHLDLPTVKGGDPQMDLLVGMRNSHTRFVDRYLPHVLNDNLAAWLARAIGPGEVPE